MKSILITGGSRGIGRATAILAAQRGWKIALTYLSNKQSADETAERIKAVGGTALCVQADVGSEEDVTRAFRLALTKLGPLDGVVINAGIVAPAMPLKEMSIDRLKQVFETNMLGAYLCAREAVRTMKEGSIVNVSSLASKTGSPGEYVDYAGSKAAMDALTVGLAKEVGPMKIRVNAVRPAFIDTEIHAMSGNPQRAHTLGAQTPLGRAGTAEEVAEAIVWLLSDASSYVSGALIDMAGGR